MIPDVLRSTAQLPKPGERFPSRTHRCARCGSPFVWARTISRGRGRGGKAIPIDPLPNDAGNLAIEIAASGRLVARPLKYGETAERGVSVTAMPHIATCGKGGTR